MFWRLVSGKYKKENGTLYTEYRRESFWCSCGDPPPPYFVYMEILTWFMFQVIKVGDFIVCLS